MEQFKTKREIIEYLQDNLYSKNFINLHTRPQLIYILKWLFSYTTFTKSMCKKRLINHIEFWTELHNNNIKS